MSQATASNSNFIQYMYLARVIARAYLTTYIVRVKLWKKVPEINVSNTDKYSSRIY
jgi:hypothetical protein